MAQWCLQCLKPEMFHFMILTDKTFLHLSWADDNAVPWPYCWQHSRTLLCALSFIRCLLSCQILLLPCWNLRGFWSCYNWLRTSFFCASPSFPGACGRFRGRFAFEESDPRSLSCGSERILTKLSSLWSMTRSLFSSGFALDDELGVRERLAAGLRCTLGSRGLCIASFRRGLEKRGHLRGHIRSVTTHWVIFHSRMHSSKVTYSFDRIRLSGFEEPCSRCNMEKRDGTRT